MTDTITATIELPRFIDTPDGRREVERVEFRHAKSGEYRVTNDSRWEAWLETYPTIRQHPVAILKPIVEYYTPTPVEACRLLADAGGPIECRVDYADAPMLLIGIDLNPPEPAPFHLIDTVLTVHRWVETIRVRKP